MNKKLAGLIGMLSFYCILLPFTTSSPSPWRVGCLRGGLAGEDQMLRPYYDLNAEISQTASNIKCYFKFDANKAQCFKNDYIGQMQFRGRHPRYLNYQECFAQRGTTVGNLLDNLRSRTFPDYNEARDLKENWEEIKYILQGE